MKPVALPTISRGEATKANRCQQTNLIKSTNLDWPVVMFWCGYILGGLEDPRHQSMNKYTEGFVGCLTDLVLAGNYRVSLLQEASEGRNVDYCDWKNYG